MRRQARPGGLPDIDGQGKTNAKGKQKAAPSWSMEFQAILDSATEVTAVVYMETRGDPNPTGKAVLVDPLMLRESKLPAEDVRQINRTFSLDKPILPTVPNKDTGWVGWHQTYCGIPGANPDTIGLSYMRLCSQDDFSKYSLATYDSSLLLDLRTPASQSQTPDPEQLWAPASILGGAAPPPALKPKYVCWPKSKPITPASTASETPAPAADPTADDDAKKKKVLMTNANRDIKAAIEKFKKETADLQEGNLVTETDTTQYVLRMQHCIAALRLASSEAEKGWANAAELDPSSSSGRAGKRQIAEARLLIQSAESRIQNATSTAFYRGGAAPSAVPSLAIASGFPDNVLTDLKTSLLEVVRQAQGHSTSDEDIAMEKERLHEVTTKEKERLEQQVLTQQQEHDKKLAELEDEKNKLARKEMESGHSAAIAQKDLTLAVKQAEMKAADDLHAERVQKAQLEAQLQAANSMADNLEQLRTKYEDKMEKQAQAQTPPAQPQDPYEQMTKMLGLVGQIQQIQQQQQPLPQIQQQPPLPQIQQQPPLQQPSQPARHLLLPPPASRPGASILPPLPPGWEEIQPAESGLADSFYQNVTTGQSQYARRRSNPSLRCVLTLFALRRYERPNDNRRILLPPPGGSRAPSPR